MKKVFFWEDILIPLALFIVFLFITGGGIGLILLIQGLLK